MVESSLTSTFVAGESLEPEAALCLRECAVGLHPKSFTASIALAQAALVQRAEVRRIGEECRELGPLTAAAVAIHALNIRARA